MSLGQTLITLGMFILLIMTVISANRMLVENPESQLQSQALTLSSLIANDLIAEIMSKPFDWKVKGAIGEIDTVYLGPWHYVLDTLWAQETTGLLTTSILTDTTDAVNWGVAPNTHKTQILWDLSSHQAGSVGTISLPDTNGFMDIYYDTSGHRRDTLWSQFKSRTALKDVDDYDGYQRIVNYSKVSSAMTGFIVNVKIHYVTSTAPDVQSSSKQFLKRIEVSVEQPQYLQKVTYTALASY